MKMLPPGYSVGAAARMHGVAAWQIRRAVERAVRDGLMEEPARLGSYRMFIPAQLPLIRDALVRSGYLAEAVTA